jgi:serine/threonine protein phosphatase PrpC
MKISLRHGTAHAGGEGHTRAGVYALPAGAVVAIADGTGESAAGGVAAQTVLKYAEQLASDPALRANYQVYQEHLGKLDHEVQQNSDAAESSIIVSAISEKGIAGYSVGSCKAWFVNANGAVELTQRQQLSPLVGSGGAALTPFAIQSAVGTVVFCTEGLWRNADQEQMLKIATGEDLGDATKSLLALARYPSGGLSADVAVVLCRLEPDA